MKSTRSEEMSVKADAASMGSRDTELELNGLKYRIPQSLNSAISRSFKREYSQKSSYNAGSIMIFDLNTGTNYVNPDSALLSFSFNLTKPPDAAVQYVWDGSLGAAALIQEIRVISKSGTELDRIQDAAQLAKIIVDYTVSRDKKRELEMSLGYANVPNPPEFLVAALATTLAADLNVVIPLKYLSGFFRPTVQSMLLSSSLASGLRLEFSLVSNLAVAVNTVGVGATLAPTNFTVSNSVLLLETSELNSPTQSILMQESASNGLEYTYPSYYSTKLSIPANGTINTQINKAVSQANRMIVILQPNALTPAAELVIDSLGSAPIASYGNYQFRVGQNYFPSLVVSNNTEKFAYAQAAMRGMYNADVGNGISYADYFTGQKAIVACSLELSSVLNLSGLMLNNSSTGEIRLTNATADPLRGVFFLEFTSVAKTSLNRTQLRI